MRREWTLVSAFIVHRRTTIASLLHLTLEELEKLLRDQLMDKVNCLDSIADVMRRALEGIGEG